MAEILNLRRARKAKAREEANKKAAENRSRFGQSKATRETAQAKAALDTRRLDGHLLNHSDRPDGVKP